jgi:hypothetical protein
MHPLYQLAYIEEGADVFYEENIHVEELFIRQLADATLIKNRLWEHTFNAASSKSHLAIHAVAWSEDPMEPYSAQISKTVFAHCAVGEVFQLKWYGWNEVQFDLWHQELVPPAKILHASSVLLNHGYVIEDRMTTILYAVMDLDCRAMLLFVKKDDDGSSSTHS